MLRRAGRSCGGAASGIINQITGVVTNGLFARRGADLALLGTPQGVTELKL